VDGEKLRLGLGKSGSRSLLPCSNIGAFEQIEIGKWPYVLISAERNTRNGMAAMRPDLLFVSATRWLASEPLVGI
jgi:hypothetical protein